jgi:hypothetical protein
MPSTAPGGLAQNPLFSKCDRSTQRVAVAKCRRTSSLSLKAFLSARSKILLSSPANPAADEVWVNTRSGKYWKPGSRFYRKTKQGEYMPELDALDRGYSPAGGTGQ